MKVDQSDLEIIEVKPGDESKLVDFAIVNIPEDVNKMTMNLLGPIIINSEKRVAVQAISLNDDYGTKVPVFNYTSEKVKVG